MKFTGATIKAIRNDIVKGTITISLEVDANERSLATAAQLSQYADPKAGEVDLEIIPRQLPLKGIAT